MSRTLSVGLASHIAGHAHTVCRMLRLDLDDGTSFGFTDSNKTISFNLGDGAIDYRPDTGVDFSDVALASGFEASDMEITGPVSLTITAAAILGGRFDDAAVRLFAVNRSDLTHGAAKILKGYVTLAGLEGDAFKLTVNGESTRFSQTVGRTITAYCDADLGDARCGFALTADTVTVTAVTDERIFTTTNGAGRANDYFNKGTVTFTSGALAGSRPVEVFDWSVGGLVALWTGLPEAPQIGDTLDLRRGCDKTRPTCLGTFDNVINFRAFPDVPGSDQVLRYPNPGG